ncbi:hypothetical protein PInf_015965 [Phytophthora infestans]|nr:hypothetical protein PInf_015965 [Phytophthora infestans]
MTTQTAGKWQVQSDDYGNIYFYNILTGESVWELPDEEPEIPDETDDSPRKPLDIEQPREHYSVYAIAVGVANVMVNIVETMEKNGEQVKKSKVKRKFMSPAAEKRFLKNAAKKKHLRDVTVATYINSLIPMNESGILESKQLREVGSLFTAKESQRWLQERDHDREVKRRAVRRARRQHHATVESRQRHQHLLIQFRSDLLKYLLEKIKCSSELQKQRILLLTTPQMLAEMKEKKREMLLKLEPEIAEKTLARERLSQQNYEKNVRKVFATIDEADTGKLHLLQILFGIFSKERPQKYAAKIRGLAELLGSPELQRFLIDFMSQASRNDASGPHLVTVREFREFVSIIEEVMDHYGGVKAAVEDAKNDIEAALAASSSGGVSLAQARMGALSEKKIKHEQAVLKEHEAQLEAARQREKKKGFGVELESLVAPKEEWEKNHHHRMIRSEASAPVYCCLCRRRKWELRRREQEEVESEYRSHWPTTLALRVKDEELRFAKERDRESGIPIEASEPAQLPDKPEQESSILNNKYELVGLVGQTDTTFLAVRETLAALVRLVESVAIEESSECDKPRRRVHKKKVRRSRGKRVDDPPTTAVLERVNVFEKEEQERKTMYTEELHMVIMLERNRRSYERPLLRIEDAAHDAFIRLLGRCVNPSGFLLRLNFERCLAFFPPQRMVLAVSDNGVEAKRQSNRLALHTIPCRTEKMAEYIFTQVTTMQKTLRSPFVAEVVAVDKHMFQLFSNLGLLVECCPVISAQLNKMMPKGHAQLMTLKELFQAAQHDDLEAVRDYLQVVLHDEMESNSPSAIQAIVEPKTNNSLLHYACDNGNLDACKYLLMCEGFALAFLNEVNSFGHTPLFYAASSGNLSLVKWLVSNGADIDTDYSDRSDIVPRDGDLGIFTPLQIACFRGHEGVANFLVECNAEVSGTRRNDKTPLHFASAQNHPAIVKLLMEAGADVHACDEEGKTPVDVAHSAVLSLLLPDEYEVQNEDNDLETGSGDQDDDEFEGDDKTKGMDKVKSAFGSEIARALRSKTWKTRVTAVTDAATCFQSDFTRTNLLNLFDGACFMMEMALQDAVTQVASSCCTSLLKTAFNAVISDKEFHSRAFHEERPVVQRIASILLLRGAGSNEKDSGEAVSSLLYLICKSTDITRHLTLQISQMMTSSARPLSPSPQGSSASSTSASWRHQLVAINILSAIANQYRLDEKTSGLSFAYAMKMKIKGSSEAIYEHTKNWCESLFKQQNQQLKPSIQAKINTGLKNALQKSKRLSNRADESSDTHNGVGNGYTAAFDVPSATMSPRSKASQREDDLPYAEPIQDQNKDVAGDMLDCFGEKATRCLFSNAWAPRVEALSYLQYLVETRQLSFESQNVGRGTLVSATQTTLLQALQDRVNSVFEAGVLLLMETSCIGPAFLLEEMIACDRSSSPPTLSATYLTNKMALVSKLLLEFGIIESSSDNNGLLPIRNVLQLALQVSEHKDPKVRQMALQIVADAMQVARSAAMPFLDALARASRQKLISKLVERGVMESDMLMDEVDDFEIPTETARPGTSGSIRPPTASGSSTKHRPALTNPSLSANSGAQVSTPYGTALTSEQKESFSNIIQGFGEELVRCLLDKAWAQREAAIREVERQVVCCASGRVAGDTALPKTLEALGMLAQVLELGLNDTVARVFQCALRLFQVIATEFLPLVASEHQYVDQILENVVGLVLQKLGDTKQRLRQDCFTLLHSMASLSHVGHARMCKMLAEKYQQLATSSNAVAASPLVIGELLRLFTMLVREAPTGATHDQPDLSLILSIVRSALDNKHVDVRNAAIATYVTMYEATNGGTNASYGAVDLNSFLAQVKPSIRETITRSVVQITKLLPTSSHNRENNDSSRPETDSARKLQRPLGVDTHKLQQICTAQITELLTSPTCSPAQRCRGVNKLMDYLVDSTSGPNSKGAWETCCLVAKQLTLDAAPSVCLAAFDLLQLLIDPPCPNASYAVPWGEWGCISYWDPRSEV